EARRRTPAVAHQIGDARLDGVLGPLEPCELAHHVENRRGIVRPGGPDDYAHLQSPLQRRSIEAPCQRIAWLDRNVLHDCEPSYKIPKLFLIGNTGSGIGPTRGTARRFGMARSERAPGGSDGPGPRRKWRRRGVFRRAAG